jgi:NADH-quinone oxidoreductase subunit G
MALTLGFTADDVAIEAAPGQNVLEACLAAGREIPYFCWHPALGAAGACRQCAVKVYRDAQDTDGQIVMACMTKVSAGLRVGIADPQAAAFRRGVIELVLTNHPHDCPVCEVGGECHLQDMAVLTGHTARRYRFAKRTHLNQALGPFVTHEMNRCIGCYRCMRFYRDVAGGEDFGVFGAHRHIYFGRAESGTLESPFAGNLTEVCPTGVFVDKPFARRFRRKWDMRATPSLCVHCALGCNTVVQERNGTFRRVQNRVNEALNGYFLCDRGRFGAGFLNAADRLRQSRRRDAPLEEEAAVAALAALLGQGACIGIGSPRASLESNYVLRSLTGPGNFYAGVGAADFAVAARAAEIIGGRGVPLATVRDVAQADAALVVGDDPWTTAPRLGLALREMARRAAPHLLAARQIEPWQDEPARRAARDGHGALLLATCGPSALDGDASLAWRRTPDQIVALGFAVAQACAAGGTAPAADIAARLRAAAAPVVVAGGAACGPAALEAGANIVLALRARGVPARLHLLLPEANSLGLALLAPRPLAAGCEAAARHSVIVLENDLSRRLGAADFARLAAGPALCALDHVETATTRAAGLALAVASFADDAGTFVTATGQAQTVHKAIFGAGDPPAAWRLLRDAAREAGLIAPDRWADHAALRAELADLVPRADAPPAAGARRPASLPYRYSGRAAEYADRDVREPTPPDAPDSPWGTTMEGPPARPGGPAPPVIVAPGWHSVQAAHKFAPAGTPAPAIEATAAAYPAPTTGAAPAPLTFIPLTDMFAAEELSALAPAISARRTPPLVWLHPADAAAHGLRAGAAADCLCDGATLRRQVAIDPMLPPGQACLTAALPGEPGVALPGPGHLRAQAAP